MSQGTLGETGGTELTFLQSIFKWKRGKQNVPVLTGSLSLILLLLLKYFLNTLLQRILQEKISRVCFSEVTRKPRLTGLLFWLRSRKLRVTGFAPPPPTLHTRTLTALTVCRSGSMSQTDTVTSKSQFSTNPPKYYFSVPAGVAQRDGLPPAHRKVSSSGQGACRGCRFCLGRAVTEGGQSRFLSLSYSLSLPLSLKKNLTSLFNFRVNNSSIF